MKALPIIITLLIQLSPFYGISSTANSPSENNLDQSRGILISVKELHEIRDQAKSGIEPYQTNVLEFFKYLDALIEDSKDWPEFGGEVIIKGRSSSDPIQLSSNGGKLVYGAAIAYHLTGDETYAGIARDMILDLATTYDYRNAEEAEFHWGAQGILNLARGGTPYIYAADLLEGWEGWSQTDKTKFQIWLRDVMYPKVAWASRWRKNNWGVSGSFSASVIAFYLMDHPEWKLKEISPVAQELTPQEAYHSHNQYQIGRMNTSREWKMDAKVSLWGILPNGAIPEEIRRGDDPIDGDHLPSWGSGTKYTMTHIEHLTAHAEFLHRHGDNSLYDHVASDGSGSLLKAYLFVVDNPVKSHCFTPDRMNAMYMAYRYYQHPALLKSLEECGPSNIVGQRLALYGRLTHPVKLE